MHSSPELETFEHMSLKMHLHLPFMHALSKFQGIFEVYFLVWSAKVSALCTCVNKMWQLGFIPFIQTTSNVMLEANAIK